ncbi:MAG TPA: DUF1425 domain-containing protein, partial [Tepidisphaeraceae bacterium]
MTKTLILSLLTFACLVGCKSITPASRGREDITDHRGVFFDRTHREQLRSSTAVLQDRVTRDQFGLLSVTIPIRSTVDRSLYLEYSYEFFDSTGKSVEGPLGPRRFTLDPGSPGTIQFSSTSNAASDYRVTVR